MKAYPEKWNILFKILVLMDNAPGPTTLLLQSQDKVVTA
jgi:hypothetical protein